jgi:hypothetical protein
MSTPAKSPRIFAKLIRGKTYYLRDKLFTPDKEVEITADERRHLKEHAVDVKHYPPRGNDDEEPFGEVRRLPKMEFRVE